MSNLLTVPTKLSLTEYKKTVVDALILLTPENLLKYTMGKDRETEMEAMIDGHVIDGEWTPNFPNWIDLTVDEMWEYDIPVSEAVKTYHPAIMSLLQGQASAM